MQVSLLLQVRLQSKNLYLSLADRLITGVPDIRGPNGSWTLKSQGRERTEKIVSTLQAIPTPTHMALVELQNRGFLKYLISQNSDGLHRRSGILPVSTLSS